MPSARTLLLALAAAALPLAAHAQDWASPPPREPSEWTVAFQMVVGAGWVRGDAGTGNGIAAEFELLVIGHDVGVGPFLAAVGSDGKSGADGVWLGLAAGWSHRLADWVRLDLLAEGGAHWVYVESDYAGEADVSAAFPFVGARAGLQATSEAPFGALLGVRRAGAGLQASARTDLGRGTLQPGTPPGAPPTAAVAVGGQALTIGVTVVLEW